MVDACLLGESRADFAARLDEDDVFPRWARLAPKLSGGGTLHAVADVFRALDTGSDSARWDPLLGSLLQVAAPDGGDQCDAVLAVLHTMTRGSSRLVRRGFDEALVMGQLTIVVRTYPWRTRTRAVAANLLLDTEHALCLETRPARMQTRRRARPLTEVPVDMTSAWYDKEGANALWASRDRHTAEQYHELVDLLAWARRAGLVDPRDLSMLVEYHYGREFLGSGHAHVARIFAVDERTSKRRCSRALHALRAAAPAYLAG
jgi:hypothetical protein